MWKVAVSLAEDSKQTAKIEPGARRIIGTQIPTKKKITSKKIFLVFFFLLLKKVHQAKDTCAIRNFM
jgi:hypothetical protein